MEDLLPIIIGIIWVAYTLYNKGLKKKRSKAPVSTEVSGERKPSFIEQLLMGEEADESPHYEEVDLYSESDGLEKEVAIDVAVPETRSPFLSNELANFVQEGKHAFSTEGEMEDIVEVGPENETVEFDLRKAIIYSEILNAPYIGYK